MRKKSVVLSIPHERKKRNRCPIRPPPEKKGKRATLLPFFFTNHIPQKKKKEKRRRTSGEIEGPSINHTTIAKGKGAAVETKGEGFSFIPCFRRRNGDGWTLLKKGLLILSFLKTGTKEREKKRKRKREEAEEF